MRALCQYSGIFSTRIFLNINIATQISFSNDDVSAIIKSDSDMLDIIEKAGQ